jgi:hypothetical protein
MVRHLMRMCMLVLSIAFAACAGGAPPTFQITQLFSNVDGSTQFVELTETAGLDGQSHFAGLELTSTHGGVVKRYTFPHDLPTDQTAHRSIIVALSDATIPGPNYGGYYCCTLPVLNASGYYCCYAPDFLLAVPRFLATDGGTVDFAGVDHVTYDHLPVSGVTSLDRNGNLRAATVPSSAQCLPGVGCGGGRYAIAQGYTHAVEYFHAASGRYFWTVSEPDIDALDSGRLAGWQRTGQSMFVGAVLGAYDGLAKPVCRFFDAARNVHFYSASTDECADVEAHLPELQLETRAAFYVALPDPATGACARDLDINGNEFLSPAYRLWNPATSDHRYTMNAGLRDQLIAQGYVAEGYGPDNVAMCVP